MSIRRLRDFLSDDVDLGVLLGFIAVIDLRDTFVPRSLVNAWDYASIPICLAAVFLLYRGRRREPADGCEPSWWHVLSTKVRWLMFGLSVAGILIRLVLFGVIFWIFFTHPRLG